MVICVAFVCSLDDFIMLALLIDFEKNGDRTCENGLPEILERYLLCVAKTGDIMLVYWISSPCENQPFGMLSCLTLCLFNRYPWPKIKPVILKKVELVVDKFNSEYPYDSSGPVLPNVRPFNFQEMKTEILELLESFYGAPFTIQRICELLTSPYRHYRWCDKFMRGLEKNVRVVTTIEPRRPDSDSSSNSFLGEYSEPFLENESELITCSIASSSSSYMNGLDDKETPFCSHPSSSSRLNSSRLIASPLQDHGSLADSMPNTPAPLQQLDSFTTVFASPPSTPLAVVSDIQIDGKYDSGSPSSSSSSSDSSPQPSSSSLSPPFLNETSRSNDDSDFEDAKSDSERPKSAEFKEENHVVNNSMSVNDEKEIPTDEHLPDDPDQKESPVLTNESEAHAASPGEPTEFVEKSIDQTTQPLADTVLESELVLPTSELDQQEMGIENLVEPLPPDYASIQPDQEIEEKVNPVSLASDEQIISSPDDNHSDLRPTREKDVELPSGDVEVKSEHMMCSSFEEDSTQPDQQKSVENGELVTDDQANSDMSEKAKSSIDSESKSVSDEKVPSPPDTSEKQQDVEDQLESLESQ